MAKTCCSTSPISSWTCCLSLSSARAAATTSWFLSFKLQSTWTTSASPSPPSPELIGYYACTSLPSDVLLDLHESFADRPVSVGILGAGQAEGVLQSMLQRGQGLLLLLQTSLVHLGLSQKLLRFLGGEGHGGGIGDVSLKTGQEAATLLYLKKAG